MSAKTDKQDCRVETEQGDNSELPNQSTGGLYPDDRIPVLEFTDHDPFGVFTMKDRDHRGPAEVPAGLAEAPLIGWALSRYLFRELDAAADASELAHKFEWTGFEHTTAGEIPLIDRLKILRAECDTYIHMCEDHRPTLDSWVRHYQESAKELGREFRPDLAEEACREDMERCWLYAVEGLRSIARLVEAFRV